MSAPVTTKTGAPFSSCSTRFSFTTDKPNGFGRNGDLVANTPTRVRFLKGRQDNCGELRGNRNRTGTENH